jgi:hypothetical protein
MDRFVAFLLAMTVWWRCGAGSVGFAGSMLAHRPGKTGKTGFR